MSNWIYISLYFLFLQSVITSLTTCNHTYLCFLWENFMHWCMETSLLIKISIHFFFFFFIFPYFSLSLVSDFFSSDCVDREHDLHFLSLYLVLCESTQWMLIVHPCIIFKNCYLPDDRFSDWISKREFFFFHFSSSPLSLIIISSSFIHLYPISQQAFISEFLTVSNSSSEIMCWI